MPIQEGGDVLVSYYGTCFNQRIILTTWYQKTTAALGALSVAEELGEILDALQVAGPVDVVTPYLACLGPQFALEEVRAQLIHPLRSAYVHRPLALVGTHASPCTVANDSACVTLRTDIAGRKEVANKHIGPVPDAVSANGLLTAPYKVLLTALGTKLIEPFITAAADEYAPEIYHRAIPGTNSLVTNFRIGLQSRVQRRRTVGLGE